MPRYVEATFDFQGEGDQLTFSAGEVIEVTQQGAEGEWWEGSCRGVTGWFPSNFCSEPYEEGLSADPTGGVMLSSAGSGLKAVATYSCVAQGADGGLPPPTLLRWVCVLV